MSDEARRQEKRRKASSSPGRLHAPGHPLGRVIANQVTILRVASATGGGVDDVTGTTVRVGTVLDGTLPPQLRQRGLGSPAAMKLGPPPTPNPSLERSRVHVGEPSSSLVETASPTSQSRSPASPA